MHIKIGLNRCWIVFYGVFVLLTAVFCHQMIRDEFRKASSLRELRKSYVELIPVFKSKARGDAKDYSCGADNSENQFAQCWYQLPRFRELFPEYRSLTDDDLSEKMYREVGRNLTQPGPWLTLAEALAFGLGAPLVVLIVGASLYWAIAGFVPKSAGRAG